MIPGGIREAVEEVFGPYAVIQRCQWHKRENIVGYLSQSDTDRYRRRLNQASNLPTYAEGKKAILAVREELLHKNLSAARSVEEGLEETLTLHRLRLWEREKNSLKTQFRTGGSRLS